MDVFSCFGRHAENKMEEMEVDEEEFDESTLEVADEETRNIQGQLYRKLTEGTLTEACLNKWKQYLDRYITIALCDNCVSETVTEFGKNFKPEVFETVIQKGECPCDKVENEEKYKQGIKLVHYVCMNDEYLPTLRQLHKLGCNLNAKCSGNSPTPLHLAIHYLQVENVKYLIKCGVNVNYTCDNCDSPLSHAISKENDEIVNALLHCKSIDLNVTNRRSQSLLAHCVRMRSQYVEALLKAGADPNHSGPMRTSALMYAVQSRNEDMVKLLIRYGADVNLKNGRESSPLMIALYLGLRDMMEILLDAGADPNDAHREDGNSLLLIACYDNNIEIVKLLIRYHANVMQKNHLEYTPLHIAAWNGHIELVRMLLKAGAAHDLQTQDKNTPLALAAHGGHLSVIEELLPLGCVVNNYDKDDDTPLHYAAYNGMTRAVELLIEHGADPNCRSQCLATPLWNAVYRKKKEVVKLLLKRNVEMEVPSVGTDQHSHTDHVVHVYNTPMSPLWVAVSQNQADIALLLVSAGYDLLKEDWLVNDQYPEGLENDRLKNFLAQYAHSPLKLIALCRNYFRKLFGLRITECVAQLNIPLTLKRYLTLEDLQYHVDEKDTSVESASDSEEEVQLF